MHAHVNVSVDNKPIVNHNKKVPARTQQNKLSSLFSVPLSKKTRKNKERAALKARAHAVASCFALQTNHQNTRCDATFMLCYTYYSPPSLPLSPRLHSLEKLGLPLVSAAATLASMSLVCSAAAFQVVM